MKRFFSAILLFAISACATAPETTSTAQNAAATEAKKSAQAQPAAPAAKAIQKVTARAWEHESSDIPVNPRIKFGKFDNGFRFAWMANSEPNKRCYIRLHVDAGSLAETDTELGMAHFLEHMAFNGSKTFPAGTLIEWFQKHGMAFGADTNAHTAFGETVYKLDLPNSDEQTISEGFQYFRDVADGLTLDEKEVQDEKGVIDGEQRERDSAGFRVMEKQLNLLFGGTRVAVRLPIGTKPVRDKFTAQSVRAFYEKWYRPENMTLVLVGDIKDFNPETLIQKYFKDLTVPAIQLEKEPALGTPTLAHKVYSIYEKEIPTVNITISRLKPWEDERANIHNMTKDIAWDFANRMINLRFSELAKKENTPFLSASVGGGGGLRVFEGVALNINCAPEKWKESLAVCEQELRRALEHGFQESELNEVRANYLRSLDEEVEREKTQASTAFLNDILNTVENRWVSTTAETDRKILKPVVEALTIEKCHKDLVAKWNEGTPVLAATGHIDLGDKASEILTQVYEESKKVKVEPKQKIEAQSFAYSSSADKTGKIKARKHIEDLDFEQIEFENGVKVNIKKTDFKEKQLMVTARMGEGALTLNPEEFHLRQAASMTYKSLGLAAHSDDDVRRLLAGKQASFGLSVGDKYFTLGGNTTKEDLLLQCELICAYLQNPGWREEGLKQYQKMIPQMYEMLEHQPQGAVMKKFMPALYSNDPRFGIPALEKLTAVTVGELKQWLTPLLADSPLEVSFIGDLDVEETIKAAAQTFGNLPARRAMQNLAEKKKVPAIKSGINLTETVDTKIPKSLVMTVFPATDGIEASQRRNISFLTTVLNDRVRINIREKLGASYSPRASAQLSQTYPGDGMITIQAMADPDKVATLLEASLEVAEELGKNGVTQEELERLREPILAQMRDQLRTNGYWLGVIAESQTDPVSLDEARALMDHYKNLKAETITALAKQYLRKDRASMIVVNPQVKEEAKPVEASTGEAKN